MTFKDRIKRIIDEQCSGSRKQFLERLGMQSSTIHAWSDEHLPNGNSLQKIRKEFNVNINWLLTGEGEPYIKQVNKKLFNAADPDGLYGQSKIIDTSEDKVAVTKFTPSQAQFSNSSQTDIPSDDRDRFGFSVARLKEIYDSNDPVLIPAIEANLKAFCLSIRRENTINDQQDEIKYLNAKCDEFEKRLKNIETKLVQSQYHRKAASNAESSDE